MAMRGDEENWDEPKAGCAQDGGDRSWDPEEPEAGCEKDD